MNILVGKVGKAIKFNNLDIRTGCDNPVVFYTTLARIYPEHNFYFIGPNELHLLSDEEYTYLFPNKNAFSLYERNESDFNWYNTMWAHIQEKGLKFDFALLFNGLSGSANIPNYLTKDRKYGSGDYVKTLECFGKYAGSYNFILNNAGCPVYSMAEDVRYVTFEGGDLYNRSKIIFTQNNATYTTRKHIASETDWTLVKSNIPGVYSGLERIMLMAMDPKWPHNIDWNRKFENNEPSKHMIVLTNGYGTKGCGADTHENTKDARLAQHEKYILNGLKDTPYENCKIYGKWTEETMKKYAPRIEDNALLDVMDKINEARYSFVCNMSPGFVTGKPWEMIVLGLIPFIHPDYDKKRLQCLPEYLYVKSPEDMVAKMRELDADVEKYKSVLRDCLRAIKPSYRDGSDLCNFIMKTIYENEGWEWTEHKGVEPIMNHFDKQILPFKTSKSSKKK